MRSNRFRRVLRGRISPMPRRGDGQEGKASPKAWAARRTVHRPDDVSGLVLATFSGGKLMSTP